MNRNIFLIYEASPTYEHSDVSPDPLNEIDIFQLHLDFDWE